MNISNTSQVDERGVTLAEILRCLWPERRLIILVTVAFAVGAGVAAFLLPKQYEASIVVSPASASSGGQLGGLSSLASQLGGLASIAGISLGGENTKKSESVAVLQSEALTERYIQKNNLLPVLYKHKWDAAKLEWKTTDPEKIPTLWKANQYFKKNVRSVSTNTKTGLVTLTITWEDPKAAARWANDLVKMTNEYMRDKAIQEAARNISYLTEEAAKTNIVEARQAIYALMQHEINQEMVARGNEEYAFRIVDPAVQPERHVSPRKTLWVLGGFFGGLGLSSMFFYIRVGRDRLASSSDV